MDKAAVIFELHGLPITIFLGEGSWPADERVPSGFVQNNFERWAWKKM